MQAIAASVAVSHTWRAPSRRLLALLAKKGDASKNASRSNPHHHWVLLGFAVKLERERAISIYLNESFGVRLLDLRRSITPAYLFTP